MRGGDRVVKGERVGSALIKYLYKKKKSGDLRSLNKKKDKYSKYLRRRTNRWIKI